jgi:hypothetical protein
MKPILKTDQSLVVSYLTLRRFIGVLGTTLPFVLAIAATAIFGEGIQQSISAYYYTGVRGVFVGMLWAIGVFMLSYKGYERRDDLAGDLACIFAIGVSLFPTTPQTGASAEAKLIGAIHLSFAAAFFLTLAYFSLFLFTRTDQPVPTIQKVQRNRVYKISGITILACLGLIVVDALLPSEARTSFSVLKPRFFLESIAVIAFGISWLTKGEAILADEPKRLASAARA